ncbi:MAG: MotA/TolQ/ExbB proton channel family protein [Spirochaetales bacterium]|nr:MotA/TolQ/ExbB proton channel family protein [Spirochaetales bacterium]
MSLLEILNKGGIINWVLLVILFISMVITVERVLYFLTTGYSRKLLSGESGQRGKGLSEKSQPGRIVALRKCRAGSSRLKDHLEREGMVLAEEMERGLWFLSFAISCAPSLGLLGTVTGLIKAFQQLNASGNQPDMQLLSGGIWEAMLTTACGLAVTIPVLLFYRIFRRTISRRVVDINLMLNDDADESERKDRYSYA